LKLEGETRAREKLEKKTELLEDRYQNNYTQLEGKGQGSQLEELELKPNNDRKAQRIIESL
jgi:hypothetical protein